MAWHFTAFLRPMPEIATGGPEAMKMPINRQTVPLFATTKSFHVRCDDIHSDGSTGSGHARGYQNQLRSGHAD